MTERCSQSPWESFEDEHKNPLAWLKRHTPYRSDANALQTLDVWITRKVDDQPPAADKFPSRKGPWIIYIHGGAWRDPAIRAASFDATVKHLLSRPHALEKIGGIASLSYSLSPHPNHPTDPSPPKDPAQKPDPSRMAVHPTHILDVLTALDFLQKKAAFGSRYVLIGHSCGATLAFQTVMRSSTWFKEFDSRSFEGPSVILGLNGLYDLPLLISEPGSQHEDLVPIYKAFTKLAFGDDEEEWRAVSPTSETDWAGDWKEGTKVVLAQSFEDSLVPYSQTELMTGSLDKSRAKYLAVGEVKISGDHNEIWEKGDRLAEIVSGLLTSL